MPELIWILDPTTGDLVVEGLEAEEALALAGDLLPDPEDLNCARPFQIRALPDFDVAGGPSLRPRVEYDVDNELGCDGVIRSTAGTTRRCWSWP